MSPHVTARAARVLAAACTLALAVPVATLEAQNATPGPNPNYELAAQWTSQKVSKMVFDTTVTPRWLETSDRFWYAYQTREGRRFSLVDPVRKTKASLFDHAQMAARLTALTRIPYDAQHLPFSSVKFVKNDAVFEFDVQVPRDADLGIPPKKTADGQAAAQSGSEAEVGQNREQQDGRRQDQTRRQQGDQRRGEEAAPARPRTKTVHFAYELATGKLTRVDDYKEPARKPRWASVSPDEKTVVFARNHNLFMMDAASYALAQKKADDPGIVEVQLTKDGEEHYSYARTVNPGQQRQQQQQQQEQDDQEREEAESEQKDPKLARVAPVTIYWSRDSNKFALVRRDQRKVGDLWVIDSLANPRPKLETYRYAMPGEESVSQSEAQVFDRETKARTTVKADRFKDQTLSIATAPLPSRGRDPRRPPEAQWLSDSTDKLYFTRLSRDMHKLDVCVADTASGEIKVLIEERLNTYIETKPLRLAGRGKELVFWSERDGWGHFYLYDAQTGALKNRITEGEFVVTGIQGLDEQTRTLFISAGGREKGEDPYYTHLYRVGLDGTGLKLLNPGDASHAVVLSDSTKYFVDNASRVNGSPDSTLVDTLGNVLAKLESPDLGALMEVGFKYPEPFSVKADDGVTDLYGVMYKPFDFDASRKYPIIAFVYPGPQTESVTKTFNPRSNNISLAQFGFIVIEVGNRGGHPQRSKWYHNYGYGNLRDYGLSDKKAAIEQLARRHSFIDAGRVGIYGHSGGGFMSTAAMLVYPDFFKVAVSSSGNHENNIYNNTWSEKHHGLKEVEKDGKVTFDYSIEKNSELAKNLKGHLLLITGDMDNNVHPANTLRMADALIKANKRFDMFVIPGKRHGYADAAAYVNWLRADYFCRHLLGKAAESVDVVELNREKEMVGEKAQR